MNSIDLLKLKNDTKCVLLNETIVSTILGFFNQSNIKTFKISKKQVNILKNNKIQGKKDLNENKIIMIMNKISHNNINELVKEYLSTITITTVEEYNVIQQEILCKLVKDITFIDNYIPFIIKIFSIEKHRLSLEPIYFISTLNKIIIDNYSSDTSDILETYRVAYLQVIKKLISFNFFTSSLYDYISKLILSKNIYKIDVYHWFNNINQSLLHKELLNKYNSEIRDTINYCNKNNLKREELMIDSLFENCKLTVVPEEHSSFKVPIDIPIQKKENKAEEFIISVNNIIEEYLYLEYIDEVNNFINNSCKELSEKNIFCQELLKYYFTESGKRISILNLYDNLIKKKIIYKSNLSKGLLLYLENNSISKQDNIEGFLKFLKANNITKNIEHVFKKYHIKINYETT